MTRPFPLQAELKAWIATPEPCLDLELRKCYARSLEHLRYAPATCR